MQIGHQNKLSQTDIATLEGNFKLKMLTLLHPAISSASVHETPQPGEFTAALGISESLLRLSVGLEDPDDIIADLKRELDRIEV